MKKLLTFIVLFLLSFSLVAAVDVSTNKVEYSSGQTVTAVVTDCVGKSIVEFRNPSGNLVDIKTGNGGWSTTYNTLSDTEDGKYKVEATCTNGFAQPPAYFCVDAPGCVSSNVSSNQTTVPAPGRGGGGGTGCTPNWRCDDWSFCGPALTQTRLCNDLNNCRAARDESRLCEECQESWVCSVWNSCSAGSQTRTCYDEHQCETTNNKPALQKGCAQADLSPLPARVSAQLPPPYVPPPTVQQSFLSKVWDNYKLYILGSLAAVLFAFVVVLIIHFFVPKKVAYNINELKQWVRKEKQMGTSDADIRQILKQNTGWNDEEIDMAFESPNTSSRTVSNTSPA